MCHPECKERIGELCFPSQDNPSKREGTIACYVDPKRQPQVPDIVLSCIAEIEQRGLR